MELMVVCVFGWVDSSAELVLSKRWMTLLRTFRILAQCGEYTWAVYALHDVFRCMLDSND